MEETKRRRYVLIANSLLCLIIIGLIVNTELMKPTPDMHTLAQNVALSILCSVVASFIFLYIQRGIEHDNNAAISGKLDSIDEKLKIQGELYDSGIKSIRKKSYYDGEDDFWKKIIQNADSRMDMIGHSLSHWLRDEYKELFCEKIVNMINAGKQVRLVLSCNPGEFDIQKINKVMNRQLGKQKLTKVERTCYELTKVVGAVAKEKRENLELYVTEKVKVTYLYIRTDSQCFISPYILSPTNSRNSFLLELETGVEYSQCFEEDFREMIEPLDCVEWSDEG